LKEERGSAVATDLYRRAAAAVRARVADLAGVEA
jgi:hypothetical protein